MQSVNKFKHPWTGHACLVPNYNVHIVYSLTYPSITWCAGNQKLGRQICVTKTVTRMDCRGDAWIILLTSNSTRTNYRYSQTTLLTIVSNCVNHSWFSCTSLTGDEEVVPTLGKLKNFSLLKSKIFAHLVKTWKPRSFWTFHVVMQNNGKEMYKRACCN